MSRRYYGGREYRRPGSGRGGGLQHGSTEYYSHQGHYQYGHDSFDNAAEDGQIMHPSASFGGRGARQSRGRPRGSSADQGGSSSRRGPTISEQRQYYVPRQVCWHYCMTGNCRYKSHCKYGHLLKNLAFVDQAHSDGIYAVAGTVCHPSLLGLPGSVVIDIESLNSLNLECLDIYTSSRESQIKRWAAIPTAKSIDDMSRYQQRISSNQGTPSHQAVVTQSLLPSDAIEPSSSQARPSEEARRPPPAPIIYYDVHCTATMPMEVPVTSMILTDDSLVCGLRNGKLKIFHRQSGMEIELVGHEADVQALVFLEGILISGDWRGKLKMWKSAPGPTFNSIQTLELQDPIRCFQAVTFPSPADPSVLMRYLWVGCQNSIRVVDLQSLTASVLTRLEPKGQKSDICMALLRAEGNVLAGTFLGRLFVYELDGHQVAGIDQQQEFAGITSMTGCQMDGKPAIAFGHLTGSLSILEPPHTKIEAELQVHDSALRALTMVQTSRASVLISAGMEGHMGLWAWGTQTV